MRGLPMACKDCGAVQPCARHPRVRAERSADTAERDKFYKSTRWLLFREWWLGLSYEDNSHWRCGTLCHNCLDHGRVEMATDVDHIKPRSEGGADFDLYNMQSLCHSCHAAKTRREQNARENR